MKCRIVSKMMPDGFGALIERFAVQVYWAKDGWEDAVLDAQNDGYVGAAVFCTKEDAIRYLENPRLKDWEKVVWEGGDE